MRIIILLSLLMINISCANNTNEYFSIAKGKEYIKQNKYDLAKEQFETVINQDSSLIEAYQELGNLYQYELKDIEKAIETYKKGLKISSSDYFLNLNIMYAYFTKNDNLDGLQYYKILSGFDKNLIFFSIPKTNLEEIIADMDTNGILSFLEKYIDINPTDTILLEEEINVYKSQKNYTKMESRLLQLLQVLNKKYSKNTQILSETTGRVYFDLGSCSYNLKAYEKALKYFEKAREQGVYVPDAFFKKIEEESKE